MRSTISTALLLAFGAQSAGAQTFPIPPASERELKRVNYHRAMPKPYGSPAPEPHAEDTPLLPLLVRPDGTRIANAQEWFKSRRSELVRQWTAILGKRWGAYLASHGFVVLTGWSFIRNYRQGTRGKQASELVYERFGHWLGMGKMVHDVAREVEYLRSLPQVDGKRIGLMGFSLSAKAASPKTAAVTRTIWRAGAISIGRRKSTHS
jgi:Dienelactone hydrolase family